MSDHWEKETQMLLQARRHLVRQLGGENPRGQEVSMRESVTDLSFADNHPADLGSENFERSKDLSLREHAQIRLRLVDEALARIERGAYGACLRCGETISSERLEAVPEAAFCRRCGEYVDRSGTDAGRRPVEEDLLRPPFDRSAIAGDPGFDSKDFWEEVARHNKRPQIYEDALEDEETGLVEETDALTNEEFRDQIPD